jgi:hypothetical protein
VSNEEVADACLQHPREIRTVGEQMTVVNSQYGPLCTACPIKSAIPGGSRDAAISAGRSPDAGAP